VHISNEICELTIMPDLNSLASVVEWKNKGHQGVGLIFSLFIFRVPICFDDRVLLSLGLIPNLNYLA